MVNNERINHDMVRVIMKILNYIKALFVKKICCGDKSCNRYWGCVNDADLCAKKCSIRIHGY